MHSTVKRQTEESANKIIPLGSEQSFPFTVVCNWGYHELTVYRETIYLFTIFRSLPFEWPGVVWECDEYVILSFHLVLWSAHILLVHIIEWHFDFLVHDWTIFDVIFLPNEMYDFDMTYYVRNVKFTSNLLKFITKRGTGCTGVFLAYLAMLNS